MAKLVLSMDGLVLKEVPLNKERVTVGRRPYNDIVIDNLAVSGEHAVIVTILKDSFLEDLGSTNGTLVNGQPIKKHFLKHQDIIELGKYKLKFLADDSAETDVPLSTTTLSAMPRSVVVPQTSTDSGGQAVIQILNGRNAGKELPLTKALTTLGKPGVQVAVITRRPQGYYITHVEGDATPLINGKAIGAEACPIKDQDVIEISGTKMAFFMR